MKRHVGTLNAHYYALAVYQMPSLENNPYAKGTYFGLACSDSLLYIHQKMSPRMLLVIRKNQKPPRYPSSVEWAY